MFGWLRIRIAVIVECVSAEREVKGIYYGWVEDKERRYKMSDSVGREVVAQQSAAYSVLYSSLHWTDHPFYTLEVRGYLLWS
jgi:hypothetical protein